MKTLCIGIFILAVFSTVTGADEAECTYTIYVKTGSKFNAGTNSKIDATLANANSDFVLIQDLKSHGIMKAKHHYFRNGKVDIFAATGSCIDTPICRLKLSSDGTGLFSGWYCEYVEVNFAGPKQQCNHTHFDVDQWLATSVSPYKLTADVDLCSSSNNKMNREFIVASRNRFPIV